MCCFLPQFLKSKQVSIPMKKFNKATGKSGYLAMHEQLEYHKDAVVRSMSLCESLEHPESSLPYKISSLNKKLYDKISVF